MIAAITLLRILAFCSIIIIVDKITPIEPQPPSEGSVRLYPVFTFLDYAAALFYEARLLALRQIPTLEDHVSVFMSPSDRLV